MLYNPNWTETKPDVLSLDALLAWLEKQPAEQTYCYTDIGHCLIAKYLTHLGYEHVRVAGYGLWRANGSYGHLKDMAKIAVGNPQNFGAALQRAKAYRDGR